MFFIKMPEHALQKPVLEAGAAYGTVFFFGKVPYRVRNAKLRKVTRFGDPRPDKCAAHEKLRGGGAIRPPDGNRVNPGSRKADLMVRVDHST